MSKARIVTRDSVRTRAAVGGRELTLDPVHEVPIELRLREVESLIPCGLQQIWGEVDVDGDRMVLTSGAGLGNGWGTIRFQGKNYCWAIASIAQSLIDAVKEEGGSS